MKFSGNAIQLLMIPVVMMSFMYNVSAMTSYTSSAEGGDYSTWDPSWKLPAPSQGVITFTPTGVSDVMIGLLPSLPDSGSIASGQVVPLLEILLEGWGSELATMRVQSQLDSFQSVAPVGIVSGQPITITLNANQIEVSGPGITNGPLTLEIQDSNAVMSCPGGDMSIPDPGFAALLNNVTGVQYFSLSSWDSEIVYSDISVSPLAPIQTQTVITKSKSKPSHAPAPVAVPKKPMSHEEQIIAAKKAAVVQPVSTTSASSKTSYQKAKPGVGVVQPTAGFVTPIPPKRPHTKKPMKKRVVLGK